LRIKIKNPEAHELAGELARLTGESMTKAVTEAIRERLERERRRRGAQNLSAELLAIGRRCAAHMRPPFHSADHEDLLYDEQGLPK
jgi:antitoxin VapB